MFTPPDNLQDFLINVPVCDNNAHVSQVLELLPTDKHELIVVTDEKLYPVGLIKTNRLLHQLLQNKLRKNPQLKFPYQINITSLIDKNIVIISVETSIWDFLPSLQGDGLQVITVVDRKGVFLGLLNQWKLLKFLANQEQFLQENTFSSPEKIISLIQPILDQIPLPLQLQTREGEIIKENLIWQQNISQQYIDIYPKDIYPPCFAQRNNVDSFQENHNFNIKNKSSITSLTDFNHLINAFSEEKKALWKFIKIPLILVDHFFWLILAQNITIEDRYKNLTIKNLDLQEIINSNNQLLTSWTHLLKSPVTALVALSNLLKEKELGQLNQRQEHYTQQIYQSSRQLMDVLAQTIELTYLESGQGNLQPQSLIIKDFCEKFCQKFETNSKIDLEINPCLKQIIADEIKLNKILTYLVNNSLNLTPENGKIGLKVELWDNWIAFTIWDNGCGIIPQQQSMLFEECQPLENIFTGKFQGTGLELIITQRLAFAHEGDISFISKIDDKTEFTLLLPAIFPSSLSTENNANYQLVLIVDTDIDLINELAKYLKQLGYYVIVARSAIEGYRKAHKLKPNFIFLNCGLSVKSEIDIFNLLKSDSDTKNILIFNTNLDYPILESDGSLEAPITKEKIYQLLSQCSIKDNNHQLTNLTILLLYPFNEEFELSLSNYASGLNSRIISCDSLAYANNLVKLWSIDVVVLDGRKSDFSLNVLLDLEKYKNILQIPLVTLEPNITATINQTKHPSVFPYLALPNNQNFTDLFEVIGIAASR